MRRFLTVGALVAALAGLALAAQAQEPAGVPEARRNAPDPTAEHAARHDTLSRVTDASSEAIRRERARRVAPIDLTWGTR